MAKVETVHKITLSSGKVVLMRDMKIKHQELAAKAVGSRHSDAPLAQGMAVQNEILRMLLVKVDGKDFLSHETLDDHLTMGEYNQCLKAMQQISGGNVSDPQIEVSSSGSK
jgi:hypothetical protein